MSTLLRILLIILLLLYILIPYDILPDFLPFAGWLDDTVLLGLLLYYFRYGRTKAKNTSQARQQSQQNSKTYRQENTTGGNTDQSYGNANAASRDKSPHEILGVSEDATPEDIRMAFRQAAQSYHPDKVAHLGPELQELAQKKFIEIQKAYEYLLGRSDV